MPEQSSYMLTEKQLSARLGITTRTLQRWRRDGGGPVYTRIGRRRIGYSVRDIETWEAMRRFAHNAAELAGGRPRGSIE